MNLVIINTLHKREYIYEMGNIIYLDQLREILEHLIKSGSYTGHITYKYKQFLYDHRVISGVYLCSGGIISSKDLSNKSLCTEQPEIQVENLSEAEKLYNKYFGTESWHIKNPIMKIHDLAVEALANLVFPGFILSTLLEKGIKLFTHKDL